MLKLTGASGKYIFVNMEDVWGASRQAMAGAMEYIGRAFGEPITNVEYIPQEEAEKHIKKRTLLLIEEE